MTDRIKGLTVVLEKPLRDDDCEALIQAIKMIRGVLDVKACVADPAHYMAVVSARHQLEQKLWLL